MQNKAKLLQIKIFSPFLTFIKKKQGLTMFEIVFAKTKFLLKINIVYQTNILKMKLLPEPSLLFLEAFGLPGKKFSR